MDKKYEILKNVFGHSKFRAFQEEIVDAILQKKDLLAILPTGGGKSLCYQLPTLLLSGTTVVVSPLIALMQDQIKALNELNINASMLSSVQTSEENSEALRRFVKGELRFLYLAPERLNLGDFIDILKKSTINYFVIDEAHCVSAWGHEFRSDYRNLGLLKANFPNTPIVAFTATATVKVQYDIIKSLDLRNFLFFKAKTKRENLVIKVQKRISNATAQILEFLKQHKNQCGIIYTFTRKEAENIAKFLQEKNYSALAYHAGLSPLERNRVYEHFAFEKIEIVVATVAFGMGIDKSNIRFVIHTSLPKTLENYYQEIGRAGRDGEMSYAYLLYSKSDEIGRMRQIEEVEDENYKKLSLQKLDAMYRFCVSNNCRHMIIARYFEDEIDKCQTLCDNCTKGEVELVEISIESQKLLSCIYKTKQLFGATHIIDILRGSKSQRILDLNHNELSVYGIGKELEKAQWMGIIDYLIDKDALSLNEHRGLKIEPFGIENLKQKQNISIDKSLLFVEKTEEKTEPLSVDEMIFMELKELRKSIATRTNVPAYIVFDDKTLRELCAKLPQNKDEFLAINGVGNIKFEKYADEFLPLFIKIKEEQTKKLQTKNLTPTLLQTLELVNQNNSLEQIAQKREFALGTIVSHIKTLALQGHLTQEQQNELFATIHIPPHIEAWIENGLSLASSRELKSFISIYEALRTQ